MVSIEGDPLGDETTAYGDKLAKAGVPVRRIGKTAQNRLRIEAGASRIDLGIDQIARARDACLAPIVGE